MPQSHGLFGIAVPLHTGLSILRPRCPRPAPQDLIQAVTSGLRREVSRLVRVVHSGAKSVPGSRPASAVSSATAPTGSTLLQPSGTGALAYCVMAVANSVSTTCQFCTLSSLCTLPHPGEASPAACATSGRVRQRCPAAPCELWCPPVQATRARPRS